MNRALAAIAAILLAHGAAAETIVSVRYDEPTDTYAHGVLGDAIEHRSLLIETDDGGGAGLTSDEVARVRTYRVRLPDDRVFEDTAPRLADLDGDGRPEIVVVETQADQGAQLAVYGLGRRGPEKLAATPHIGTRFRWLAPAAIADFDSDGRVEIAYVDRPHLARILRIVRYDPEGPRLTEVAAAEGHTNHRIGDREILGGLRTCAGQTEIVTASPDWSRLLATRLAEGVMTTRDIGANRGPRSVSAALACR